ncbi:hypothetical protein ACJX0J_006428, partial [Zea mays]
MINCFYHFSFHMLPKGICVNVLRQFVFQTHYKYLAQGRDAIGKKITHVGGGGYYKFTAASRSEIVNALIFIDCL